MRVAFLAVAALLAVGAGNARAMTAHELLDSCDVALRTLKSSGSDLSIARAGQACWNYMEAVQDMVALADESGHRVLNVCVPEGGRTDGLVRAFTKYARAHTDELETRASVVVLHGLWAEFPCK